MKQEAGKNQKKWLWLAIALVALLAVAGIVLALLLPGQKGPDSEGVAAELYWNVDRLQYIENAEIEGSSDRVAAEDGNYYIRYAYKGQQMDLQIVDKQLVNWLDQRDLVGLIFDSNGVVVDAVEPEEVATKSFQSNYVRAINGNEITINSSSAMNGMESVIELTENTGVYDVDRKAEVVGACAELGILDQILVYSNAEGEVTHVYITERCPNAGIYWRLERMWDSAKGMTTRVPDENGVYTIAFAHEGEHVELKTKSLELVNYVDSQAPLTAMFAPIFDEEGYIIEFVSVALSLRGTLQCIDYHVTAVDGDTVTVKKISAGAEQGKEVTFTLNDACKMYMCCDGCYEHLVGEKITELKLYDRVYVYTDLEGNPVMIFVARRMADCTLYYNLERLYSRGKTTREPVGGYYVFEMASEGKKVTLRTKDEQIANEIDALSHQAMGLKVNGDIIERVYPLSCVNGGGDYGTNRYITMLTGPVFEAMYYTDFENKANGVMSADCKIYDVTTGFYGVNVGEETTVNMYDKITYLKDLNGEICTIFVTDRYVEDVPLYYNLSRKYSTKTESTTREPDADGYYVYNMITGSKEVQVKTKNKSLASFIDKQNAPFVALKVSGGIVKAAYPAVSTVKYGYKTANYHYVDKINKDGSFNTYFVVDGVKSNSIYTYHMTEDCKIYNVSTAYDKARGERTKLKVGDQIQVFAQYPRLNPDVDTPLIYVMNRKLDSPMYKNVKQMYNWTTKETTRQPNADGWYVFDLAANGTVKQYKTKDKAIATQVDSYDLGFTLVTDGDIITRVCSPTLCKDVSSSVGSFQDVMSLNGNKASLKRNQPNAANYGETTEVTFAKNCVFYDYSPYAENFGAKTTLSVGDRVHCYTNMDGEVIICFILYKNTHEKGYISYCDHCKQDVFWNPYTGSVGAPDAHYYVTHDGNITYQGVVGNSTAAKVDQTDVVLDLNGHAMTTTNRGFLVYGTLSILDTVGGGSITAGNNANGNGGCIMLTNDATLNLYDGVLSVAKDGGTAKIGGVIYLGGKAVMNMYGGRITGGYAGDRGGNIIINGCTFNMYGGTIDGGIAENSGNNIMATMSSTINIFGGKITGDVIINSKSNVTLSGSPVITKGQVAGMSLATGVLVDVTGLKQDASIVISANGQFTDNLTNAQNYLSSFVKEKDADKILVKEDALYYDKAPKDLNNADNSALKFETGTTKAYCPYCERTVTWKELTSTDETLNLTGGEHYYLTEDVVYGGVEWLLRAPSTDAVSCVHLNGHNVTAPNGRLAQGYPGILNIMGEGIVSGNFIHNIDKNQGSTINTNTNNKNGAINLIGGTYTAPDTNTQNSVVSVAGNGGTVNIYDGAKIESGSKSYSVHVGVAALTDGTFGMYGGTLSGSIYMSAPSASAGHDTILNISGGTIKGGVQFAETTTVNLSGNPVVSGKGMVVPAGAKINLGELTQGADILISASGIFTEENENAADYADFFTTADEKAEVIADGNALRYTFPGAIALDADGYAFCEACGEKVKWEVLSDQVYKPASGSHYYFKSKDGSGVVSTPWQLATWPDDITADFTLCLHLNGQRVETGSRMFLNTGTVNIMGDGTLAGTGTTTSPTLLTGTLSVNGGTVNLYGGTYTSEVAGVPAIATYYSSATVNLHNVTVIGGVDVNNGTLSLTGAPVIEKGASKGLNIAEGVQITVNELTDGADITVSASGVFTKENENIQSYAAYFKAPNGNDRIDVQDNALVYTKVAKDLNTVDNAKLVFDDNTTNAECPVCGETVTWTALSGDAAVTLSAGHYFLSDDITYTGTDVAYLTAPGNGLTACVHLNGYDITATANRVIEGNGSTLNIMGEGTVSGSYNENRLYGATINMAAGESEGNINLIGGVYTKNVACDISSIVMLRNGGDVNLYAGAEILGVNDGKSVTNVSVFYHSFNMYGGKLSGGTGTQVTTNNWSSTKTGLFTMTGGEITGNVAINGNESKYGGSTISGGTINGTVTYARYTENVISGGTITEGITMGSTATSDNSSITLSGAPVITGVGMKLNTGYLLTLDELVEGADILISASGVFTAETEKAADYAEYFKATDGYEVVVRGNALSCAAEGILELDADGYGWCDACQQTVEWTAISGQVYKKASGSHCYFVSNDGSDLVSTPYQLVTWPDDINADYKICLHLNGHRVETASRLLMNMGTVNIMGKGVLAGTGTTTSANLLTGTFTINGGTLNLYGGVYTSDVKGVPAIITKYNSATVNLYNASVVGGYEISKGTLNLSGPSVVDTISVAEGKLNVMENWTGTATAAFASLTDNTIPAANGTSEGDYTGSLFLADRADAVIKAADGALKIVSYSREDDGVLKILAIGNSFAVDSTNLLYEIYKAENPNKQIVIGVLNCSGASLLTHVRNLNSNLGSYYYHRLDSDIYASGGKWKIASKATILEALRDEDWDIVTMQQASGSTPDATTYNGYIGIIRNYVTGNLGYKPEFAWNFTWSYPDDDELLSTNTASFIDSFKSSYGTSEAMYNKINQAVQDKIVNGAYSFDYLMPVGTAIQNARVLGLTAKDLYRDSLHMNNLGRLVAAYTWYCELENVTLTDLKLTKIPAALALTDAVSNGVTELDDTLEAIVIESVNSAIANKFSVIEKP